MNSPSPTSIDLRHLRYFLAVMEELHFGRAASRLHISQPPLSQAIRKLETELGVQLLRRNSRTVAPTAAGRVFAGEARRVLTAYETAVAETRRAGGVTSTLRIGCVPYVPVSGLQRLIAALVGRCPAVDVRVTHLLALEQVERLRAGELDVGIFCHAEEHPDTVVEPLFPGGEIFAHLSYNHRLADRNALTPKDLAEEEIVLFPRDANPAIFDGMLSWADAAGYTFAGVRPVPARPDAAGRRRRGHRSGARVVRGGWRGRRPGGPPPDRSAGAHARHRRGVAGEPAAAPPRGPRSGPRRGPRALSRGLPLTVAARSGAAGR
jgi:DNA-binding transcriptional LysR family regulator